MLKEMYRLLSADAAETAQLRSKVALLNETPYSLDVSFERYGVPIEVHRLFRDWGVDSFAELADELGEKWPWFYDRTRSAHIRQWPSLVSLAIRLANGMNSASAPRNRFTEVGTRQISSLTQSDEYSANASSFLLNQTGAFQDAPTATNDFSLHDAA